MLNLNSKRSDANSSQACKQKLSLVLKYHFRARAKLKFYVLLKYTFIIWALVILDLNGELWQNANKHILSNNWWGLRSNAEHLHQSIALW